jgi:hypothetical protein
MLIELSDYMLGGVFVTRPVLRPDYSHSDLLPDNIVSLSSCICQFFPATWSIEWTSDDYESRAKSASVFGITEDKLKPTIEAITGLFADSFGWESVIYSREAANRIVKEFLPTDIDFQIIGAALHRSHVETYLKYTAPPKPKPGFAPAGAHGTYEVLSKGESPEVPHEILGFELLVYDHGLSHSWLCNGLEKECHHKLNVLPNAHGLIDNFDDAWRCTEHISSDKVGAEPGLWLPWLLLRYG